MSVVCLSNVKVELFRNIFAPHPALFEENTAKIFALLLRGGCCVQGGIKNRDFRPNLAFSRKQYKIWP